MSSSVRSRNKRFACQGSPEGCMEISRREYRWTNCQSKTPSRCVRLRLQILKQPGEGDLELVVLLPMRKIGDVVSAHHHGDVLAGVGIKATPVAQFLDIN